jgi:arsenate reductase (glutaredoxin)
VALEPHGVQSIKFMSVIEIAAPGGCGLAFPLSARQTADIRICDTPPLERDMAINIYGIPNCDTVKKARQWLEARGVAYAFHDYKKLGADPEKLSGWCDAAGWDVILNRAGTTFKKLSDAEKSNLDQGKAVLLMEAQPSMIKRPVVEYPGGLLVGFKVAQWEEAFPQ